MADWDTVGYQPHYRRYSDKHDHGRPRRRVLRAIHLNVKAEGRQTGFIR